MKPVFADTFYWIALLNPRDNWHQTVLNYTYDHPTQTIITTDGVDNHPFWLNSFP